MGRGSIRQRGRDSWQLRVYLGTDPETGRQRWATRTVHGSRRHAQAQLRELVEEAGYAHMRAGTLADLLESWFEAASPGWARTTVSHTRSVIDCYLKPYLGHFPVAKLTTEDIDDFYGHLLRAGGRRDQPLAPGTVARVHGVLHRALAQAVRWEWIWLNPASNASPPRVPPAEIRPPSPKQVARLLEAVRTNDPALFCFLRLAASTGLAAASSWLSGGKPSIGKRAPSLSPGHWSRDPTDPNFVRRRHTGPTERIWMATPSRL